MFEAGDSLVYSYNDWAGLGLHGDFLNGWQEGAVEDMLDYCIHHQVEAYSTVLYLQCTAGRDVCAVRAGQGWTDKLQV